jgi:hypothetical protein
LRLQGDDALDAWVERVANSRHAFSFHRVIAEGCVPNQLIAGADCEDNLRQIWGERNNPVNSFRDCDFPPLIVDKYPAA